MGLHFDMTNSRRHHFLGGLFGLLAGIALACGDGDGGAEGDGGACVPGQQVTCPCPDGSMGVQACEAGGAFFEPCMCGGGTEGASATDGDTEDGNSGSSGADLCGNGIEDPGECPGACPADCTGVDSSSGDGGTTGEPDTCADVPVFVAAIPTIPSRWESGALVGFAAGQDMCRNAAMVANLPDPMQVTVCDYEQVLEAEAAGELAAIPAGTTAWIHRTTNTMVNGVASVPGSGGRCVDWIYQTNHISDGEFVTIGAGGVGTYSLDGDTFYDGVDTTHTQPGLLECGTQMRSILCCNPPCDPQG